MKKCIVISDSFKGTLSSLEICKIAEQSIPRFFPECEVITLPVADGGEGTVDCFVRAVGATRVHVSVSGPNGAMVDGIYGRVENKAIIEMASAAGLPLVGDEKNPGTATTYGVGQMIQHAIKHGCDEILLGLGGSCTNDGGCGCAAALGTVFYDRNGNSFVPVGNTLGEICRIDTVQTKELLKGVRITAMCDVNNRLYGINGAAYVYAPQKGASEELVEYLDGQLRKFDAVLQTELGISVADIPGSGAGGGMAGGSVAFLGAKLRAGIEAILDLLDFDALLENTDLVITGEGRLDGQSVRGKVISGIARRTKEKKIPLIAIVGSIADDAEKAYDIGVTAMFGIDRKAVALHDYIEHSAEYYRRTMEDIMRLIKTVGQFRHNLVQ